MRRREFIKLLGGVGLIQWPRSAAGQQNRPPVVGVLRPNPKINETFFEPFGRYMRAIGWEEGRNIRFLFLWAEGHTERLSALAGDLVAQQVDVILTLAILLPARCNKRPRPFPSLR
jgi:hypothetical protein